MVGGRAPAQRPLTSDPGLYGPGSEAWNLNREAALLLGAGPRALLLQLAHPLVAEGVDQHSDFRVDPWARLAGTLRSYLRIVYGTTGQARAEIRRLNRLHGGVTGPVRDPRAAARLGGSYAARDPELSLWVHATLIDSTLATVDAWLAPLSPERRARFYAETRPVGRLFGIPEALLPADIDAFDAWMAAQWAAGGPVHPIGHLAGPGPDDPASAARPGRGQRPACGAPGCGLRTPRRALGRVPAGAASWLLVPAIGLLPAAIRDAYGFPWGARERVLAAWLVTAWRAWRPVFPERSRWFPQALAADRRTGGG